MQRVAVLNVVGLTPGLIGTHTPRIKGFAEENRLAVVEPAFPAVTCSAQSNYLTGVRPSGHGIVANGWYHRELAEVQFWKQSNHLVGAPKIWDRLRADCPGFTCAKLFWWYNMYSSADFSITPRPMYPADGRKVFDIYTHPSSIRSEIKKDLGEFPFPFFWGPLAGIRSSEWIAESAKWIEARHHPTLSLIYLPHLDYNLQRLGPDDPGVVPDLQSIDRVVGDLIDFFERRSVQVLLVSEYGITAVDRPVHLNRHLREKGWIAIREELGLELMDAGASDAFAVADHQVAHIYVNRPGIVDKVRAHLEKIPGVEKILGAKEQQEIGIAHARAGDLVAIADSRSWFTYYYWNEDAVAPDFARCVDIHRKPGYDPVELFTIPNAKPKILWRLLKKKLGFRMLMNVIPLDATLVKGSHGRRPDRRADFPLVIGPASVVSSDHYDSTGVFEILRRSVAG